MSHLSATKLIVSLHLYITHKMEPETVTDRPISLSFQCVCYCYRVLCHTRAKPN